MRARPAIWERARGTYSEQKDAGEDLRSCGGGRGSRCMRARTVIQLGTPKGLYSEQKNAGEDPPSFRGGGGGRPGRVLALSRNMTVRIRPAVVVGGGRAVGWF